MRGVITADPRGELRRPADGTGAGRTSSWRSFTCRAGASTWIRTTAAAAFSPRPVAEAQLVAGGWVREVVEDVVPDTRLTCHAVRAHEVAVHELADLLELSVQISARRQRAGEVRGRLAVAPHADEQVVERFLLRRTETAEPQEHCGEACLATRHHDGPVVAKVALPQDGVLSDHAGPRCRGRSRCRERGALVLQADRTASCRAPARRACTSCPARPR